jgi:hypothetical protein
VASSSTEHIIFSISIFLSMLDLKITPKPEVGDLKWVFHPMN